MLADAAIRLDEATELGPEYASKEGNLTETIEAMGDIARESRYSWAEVKKDELNRSVYIRYSWTVLTLFSLHYRRQQNLATDLTTILSMLASNTGANIYTVAVFQRDGQVTCVE